MTSRQLADGRSIRLPEVDPDELTPTTATFTGAFDLDSALVDGGDATNATGAGALEACLVRQLNLSHAKLSPLTLVDVIMTGVDLSNATLHRVTARRTEFRTCRAIGLHLTLDNATDVSITDSRLDYATVDIAKVRGALVFTGCTFRESIISGDLSNTLFLDCDFHDTEFRATRAAGCDLRTSRITSAHGLLSLRGTKIDAEQALFLATILATEAGLIVD
ncbi:MAG TPA: pentapeptide repeat-containing protein [Actinophytocola sp.]|uniref:pentapeptide repeat-containing protein n=1 Tax=Actinophytocola sp. TaxID=1872138 RepID=UPI002DBF2454|nr:pentapeptide repeat-containing protein [Actinophytocola sp.]HEU5472320.1 pentapeptide repeat-containing protein [Actinophytocola sp.]